MSALSAVNKPSFGGQTWGIQHNMNVLLESRYHELLRITVGLLGLYAKVGACTACLHLRLRVYMAVSVSMSMCPICVCVYICVCPVCICAAVRVCAGFCVFAVCVRSLEAYAGSSNSVCWHFVSMHADLSSCQSVWAHVYLCGSRLCSLYRSRTVGIPRTVRLCSSATMVLCRPCVTLCSVLWYQERRDKNELRAYAQMQRESCITGHV